MYIPCFHINRPYIIHGVRKESVDDGISKTECTLSVEEGSNWINGSKAIFCWSFDNNTDREKNNIERFVKETQEVLNPLCMELNSYRRCTALSSYGEICKKWERLLPILYSKYCGKWVEEQIEIMTERINNKKRLEVQLYKHFIVSEWFQRNIYKVDFTDEGRAIREYQENGFIIPLTFLQQCSFERTDIGEQTLIIKGNVDLEKNTTQIEELCRRYEIKQKQLVSIEQHTEIQGKNLSGLINRIHSIYSIKGENNALKTVEIELTAQ